MNESSGGMGTNGGRSELASNEQARTSEEVRSKVENARQPAADKLHSAAEAIRENADRIPGGETGRGAARSAADKVEASASYLESHDSGEIMSDAVGILKRYPVQALLIAGTLGFLMARALRSHS